MAKKEKSKLPTGIERIAAERERQIKEEGYTPEYDRKNSPLVLLQASLTYLKASIITSDESFKEDKRRVQNLKQNVSNTWPWPLENLKPSLEVSKNIEKSAALLAAALDRLQLPPALNLNINDNKIEIAKKVEKYKKENKDK